jgi:hypothetical protein
MHQHKGALLMIAFVEKCLLHTLYTGHVVTVLTGNNAHVGFSTDNASNKLPNEWILKRFNFIQLLSFRIFEFFILFECDIFV